jgi:hypothetical protein
MATKNKTKKKSTKSKKSAGKKLAAKPPARKRGTPKKSVKKKAAPKKTARKKVLQQTVSAKTERGTETNRRNEGRRPVSSAFPRTSGSQSGDMQGVSSVESVDSESVDELLEEGNAFEAGVVSGVEDSRAREGKEVRTREVPEDDVPAEYLDEE